ncbi:hypothetical protein BaRGS_00036299 [Batillaria attramentaria]|uniref:Uncharacterized protein n=1 Tax=Batillaria attramentaria TaxID=370345 RepID=A0ABD0JDJ6_9CAEN
MNGHHVIRRSDRFWAGLSSDLIIEQVLMGSLKSTGGLTRGTGMGEEEHLTCLAPWNACMHRNLRSNATSHWCALLWKRTDRHEQDQARERSCRYQEDRRVPATTTKNVFGSGRELRNIASGRVADPSVNVDNAKVVGMKILRTIAEKKLADISLKKSDQAVSLAVETAVTVREESVVIDPNLLFQRLVKVAETSESLADYFRYELTNIPTSLFDN